jgi:hypothetical protein
MAQALKLDRRLMLGTKFTQASHPNIEITGRSNEFSNPRWLALENTGSRQASCLFEACNGTFHVRPGRILLQHRAHHDVERRVTRPPML